MGENHDDLLLLQTNPDALLLKCQDIFRAVALVYRRAEMIPGQDLEEVIQEMNLRFLRSLEIIRHNYDPGKSDAASLRAYIRSLARNVCRKYARDHPEFEPLTLAGSRASVAPDSVTSPIFIAQTVEVFRAAVETTGDRRPRVLLLLKLYYKIPISARDITAAYPEAQVHHMESFLERFGIAFSSMADREVFQAAGPYLNRWERARLAPESYLRRASREVLDLCEILNGDPPVAAFDRDSLAALVDDYFDPFLVQHDESIPSMRTS
jgi:DNA-directed RNA polymerase specialized sigma24 family protein